MTMNTATSMDSVTTPTTACHASDARDSCEFGNQRSVQRSNLSSDKVRTQSRDESFGGLQE